MHQILFFSLSPSAHYTIPPISLKDIFDEQLDFEHFVIYNTHWGVVTGDMRKDFLANYHQGATLSFLPEGQKQSAGA